MCVVLIVVTQNIIVAIYTTLTVLLIMMCVAGILVLMGWEQGIMESIIISCGIGMACDFAAHLMLKLLSTETQSTGTPLQR